MLVRSRRDSPRRANDTNHFEDREMADRVGQVENAIFNLMCHRVAPLEVFRRETTSSRLFRVSVLAARKCTSR